MDFCYNVSIGIKGYDDMKNMKHIKHIILAVSVLSIIMLFEFSNAWYQLTVESENEVTLTSGNLELSFEDGGEIISLDNALPVSDAKGLSINPYTFTIKNTGTIPSNYTVYLEDVLINGSRMDDKFVKYSLVKMGDNDRVSLMNALPKVSGDDGNSSRVALVGNLNVNESVTYNLKVWISEDATNEAMGTEFKARIKVSSEQSNSGSVSNPILNDGMIPVTYNGHNFVKADSMNLQNSWYDYNDQNWANAVTIKTDEKRELYKNAQVGSIISDSDINGFYVWIPRFSYTLKANYGVKLNSAVTPTIESPGAFDIKFISTDTVDDGVGIYTDNKEGTYITPVGFCFGDTCATSRSDSNNVELNGVWVSKFEITGSLDNISSVPNLSSLTNIEVGRFFNSIKDKMNGDNGLKDYGFTGQYDTHMIKNSEWSLVAYLAQSKYGKYGNTNYSGVSKAVNPNKSSNHVTGHGITNAYNTTDGFSASTTGNITGVYDMVGGASEYVMANLNSIVASSNISNMPSKKYYDLYTNKVVDAACGNLACKGQNLNSTRGWYNGSTSFVNNANPWLKRGVDSSIFSYSADSGISNNGTTRISIVSW